ncbi:MAG: glycosyl hydrolase 53 family protein [Fimbriimonadaceae bacterium]|nr:glycosyl hydrolase 53 family protein [Fimbriimonadaceae bacterium]
MMVSLALAGAIAAVSAPVAPFFYAGGDPSEIPEVEASGAVFRVKGKSADPLKAMKEAGWTAIRLRVWNEPKDGYCDMAHTLALAKRVHALGMKLMIDFHYSDWWADPGKQHKPAAWRDLPFPELKAAVRNYSRDVIKALVDQGTPPDVVQAGNEVVDGMLWPDGRIHGQTNGWPKFVELTNAAIEGIREGAGKTKPKIMAHIDRGGKIEVSKYWFENYFAHGGEADILGLSYYPFWHGTLDDLKANLEFLAKTYKKPILVAETAYPYVGWNEKTRQADENAVPIPEYKATPEGQAAYFRKLIEVVKATPDGLGVGVLWWAPAWIGEPGRKGGWSRNLLFDSDTGEALPALWAFQKRPPK